MNQESIANIQIATGLIALASAVLNLASALLRGRQAPAKGDVSSRPGRLYVLSLAAMLTFGVLFLIVSTIRPTTAELLRSSLEEQQPGVFDPRDSAPEYAIARLFATRDALVRHASLKRVLVETQGSFDLLAHSPLAVLDLFRDDIMAAVARGVHVRILILDADSTNDACLHEIARQRGMRDDVLRQSVADTEERVRRMTAAVLADPSQYPGSLLAKRLPGSFGYTTWIRDPSGRTALASVGLYATSYPDGGPYFWLQDPTTVKNLESDFGMLWTRAAEIGSEKSRSAPTHGE